MKKKKESWINEQTTSSQEGLPRLQQQLPLQRWPRVQVQHFGKDPSPGWLADGWLMASLYLYGGDFGSGSGISWQKIEKHTQIEERQTGRPQCWRFHGMQYEHISPLYFEHTM